MDITCPICYTKFEEDEDKVDKGECPQCNAKFIFDNNINKLFSDYD